MQSLAAQSLQQNPQANIYRNVHKILHATLDGTVLAIKSAGKHLPQRPRNFIYTQPTAALLRILSMRIYYGTGSVHS